MPEDVTSIPAGFFGYMSELREIHLPPSLTAISDGLFKGCWMLESIDFPEGVAAIGAEAFSGCASLTDVVIPASVTKVGDSAFESCSSLTKIHLPDTVLEWGSGVFWYCSALTDVNYPLHMGQGSGYFFSASGVTSMVIPEGVTCLPYDAFSYCKQLTSVTIPSTVKTIGDYCFQSCLSLTDVRIAEGVETIGERVFYETGLVSIDLPDSITTIKTDAFWMCASLSSVKLPANLKVLGSSGDLYFSRGVFEGCSSLTEIELPDTLEVLGIRAFRDCTNLREVIIPDGVQFLYGATFYNCANLEKVYVPASVQSITQEQSRGQYYRCFDLCPKLKVYTEYGSPIVAYLQEQGLSYHYSSVENLLGPKSAHPRGDELTQRGTIHTTDPITEVEIAVTRVDNSEVVLRAVAQNVGKTAFNYTYLANGKVRFSKLDLGEHVYTIKVWTDTDRGAECDTVYSCRFEVVLPALRLSVSEDFVPPEAIHPLGTAYAAAGEAVCSHPMEKIQVRLINQDTGDVYASAAKEPNDYAFSMKTLHADLDFAAIPEGYYEYEVITQTGGKWYSIYRSEVYFTSFDGGMDADKALNISYRELNLLEMP